jgi:hypothetical protein
MAKSTKRFVISDNSLNEYGFRILTAGVDLKQFKKNPIMLWMHFRPWKGTKDEVLPLGYWDDITVEDDVITAAPVFDDKDDFAMSIYEKVEAGIIRMASGGFRVTVWSEDPKDLMPGQTRATATKSVMKEASICDLGANNNALALYDENDEMVKLSDQTQIAKIPLLNNSENDMKIELTAEVKKALNLTDASDVNAALTSINGVVADNVRLKTENETLTSTNTTLKTENENLKVAGEEKAIDALLTESVNKGKITNAQLPFYKKLANGKVETIKELLDSMPESKKLSDDSKKDDAGVEELRKLSYDQLDEQDKLEELKEKDLSCFEEKYKAKWGKEYGKK